MTDDNERQVLRAFDDGPQRFRDKHDNVRFSGASGVLFEQAMAQTRMAICLSDPRQPDSPIVFTNRAFIELTGYPEDEIVGRNCRFLQGPDTDLKAVQRIRRALEQQDVVVVELLNYRKDGTKFWNALHLGPIYDSEGELLYYFGSQWDVSDVHAARADEAHAKAMSRELSHRMKNMFSVIASIVNVTGRMEGHPDIARSINERVHALGRAYEPTLDDARLGAIEVGQAVRSVLGPYDPQGTRINYLGNGLRAESNIVSILGLALHELATNAVKYGALKNEEGTIDVNWSVHIDPETRENQLRLDWIEKNPSDVEITKGTSGTGLSIMEVLLRSANGTVTYDWHKDGLQARVMMPLEEE